MGLEAAICFAKMNESGDKEDRVGMQIANPNLIVQTEALKERMYQNPKSPFKKVFKHHDLTWLWIGVPLVLRRMPSYELLVVEYPHVTRSSMVCSLLFDFHHSFSMTPIFFYASLFAISFHFPPQTPALLVNGECADLQ